MPNNIQDIVTTLNHVDISNPHFASNLNNLIDIINQNFSSIVNAPFLKGDRGNSVYSTDDLIETSLMDEIKRKIDSTFGGQCTDDELEPDCPNSIDSIRNRTTFFVDDVTGRRYLSNPFFFIDARLNWLMSHGGYTNYEGFVDKSCMITATKSNGVWIVEIHKVVPSLYFDTSIRQYCWMVNDEKTGIVAQGVKGDDGLDGHSITLCRGIRDANSHRIELKKVFVEGRELAISGWESAGEGLNDDYIGTVAIVISGLSGGNIDTISTGVIYKEGNDFYVAYQPNLDISLITNNIELGSTLNNIGMQGSVRGLYVPSTRDASDGVVSAHMLWSQGTQGDAHIGRVGYQGLTDGATPTTQGGSIHVDYSDIRLNGATTVQGTLGVQGATNIRGNATVGGNTAIQGNTSIQGGLGVQGSVDARNGIQTTRIGLGSFQGNTFNEKVSVEVSDSSSPGSGLKPYLIPSLDFKVERRFSGDKERNILTVSNPWIGWCGPGSSPSVPEYTESLHYSTRLVDEEGNDTISIDLNGIMYTRTQDTSNWIWRGVNIGRTAIPITIEGVENDSLYFNQESRVLYYHTPTATYAIGLLIQTILTTDNVEVLFKVFDVTRNSPRALKVVKGQTIQTLLPVEYNHINSNSRYEINNFWSYLNGVNKTRNLPTLHLKLSLKTGDEHIITIQVPDYKEKYKILNVEYSQQQVLAGDSFLCWRVTPDGVSVNSSDLIYNPDTVLVQDPGNCLISGAYYNYVNSGRLRPSILLGLNESTPIPNPGSILQISRGEHTISTKLEGLIEEYIIYSSKHESTGFISTYKIYLPDSLYIDKRDVEYKKPLVKLNSTQPSTTTDGNTGSGNTNGETINPGAGGESEFNPVGPGNGGNLDASEGFNEETGLNNFNDSNVSTLT